jgi:hypothetical protein
MKIAVEEEKEGETETETPHETDYQTRDQRSFVGNSFGDLPIHKEFVGLTLDINGDIQRE